MKKRNKLDQKVERQNMIEQGFYDGRFAPKKFLDKKKEQNKRSCKDFSWN